MFSSGHHPKRFHESYLKSRPESGRDCLVYAIFARQQAQAAARRWSLAAGNQAYLTQNISKVVFPKSIPTQIRQLILYIVTAQQALASARRSYLAAGTQTSHKVFEKPF